MFPSSQKPAVAPLETVRRIPKATPLPLTAMAPTLQATKKPVATSAPVSVSSPAPYTTPTSFQTKPPEGINPPVLEKVVKPLTQVTRSPHTVNNGVLRPSWPTTHVEPKVIGEPLVNAKRVEDPRGLYIVHTQIHTMGINVSVQTAPRFIVNGIFTFDKAMCQPGKDITDKLVNYALEKVLPPSMPEFLKMGLGMGTSELNVSYPVAGGDPDIVAKIVVGRAEDKEKPYRTITIRRFKPDTITSLEL